MKYEQPNMTILELMNVCICHVSPGSGDPNDTPVDDGMFND